MRADRLSYEDLESRLASAEAELEDLRRKMGSDRADLVESERRYRALFENMNAGFVLFEPIRDEAGETVDLRIVAANRGFESTTGLVADEVTGELLTRVLPGIEKDEADWIGKYGEVARTGESIRFEQGSELLGYFYSVHAYQAAPGQCAVTFFDITERKMAEAERDRLHEQLLQSQKMESIGRLAGGVAHDFNNMLSVILGYCENMIHQLREGDPLREDVQMVVEAGRRSAVLTRQLLAFSRKQTLQPVVLDINDVVGNLESMLRRMIGEDIDLKLMLSPTLDRVLVDPGQLEQVIMNLAVNARDAMPTGGKLLIETDTVELGRAYADEHAGVEPGPHVMLAITDTGCGMDEETRSRIFEPFFTTKRRGEGTGLGLAMVYGIVRQSGGNIWIYSEPGQGTTFKIYFPRTSETRTAPEKKAAEKVLTGSGEHVLVVEDEQLLRQFLRKLLPRFGYGVTAVGNGGEALLMIEEQGLRPDLILTDVVMPNMSGKELMKRLDASNPGLKVLYMSGYTDNAIVHHGVLDPGTPFLQKPFTNIQLMAKLREVLDGDD